MKKYFNKILMAIFVLALAGATFYAAYCEVTAEEMEEME